MDSGGSGGIDSGTEGSSGSSGEVDESSSTDPSAGGSTTGGEAICDTVLCGDAQTCCATGDECVLGACLPACDSGVRCGDEQEVCCGAGQGCFADQCVDPSGPCVDSFDCELGEFCEPTLDQCFPQLDPVGCELIPDFEEIAVTQEWSYEAQEVISIPLVADIDGDGTPEVVLNLTQQEELSWPGGSIVVLDGRTGAIELELPDDPIAGTLGSHGRSTLGLTDVSGDGLPDIVYAGRAGVGGSLIHAVDHQGNLLWTSHGADGSDYRFNVVNGAPSFANFDDDEQAEIVFGAAMLDHDGLVVWDQDGGGAGAAYGTNFEYTGGISALADLTGDGYPEVVSGADAWSVTWTQMPGQNPSVAFTSLWNAAIEDGYPAIADVDLDGNAEVVLVASGMVHVLEGDSGLAWCGVDPTEAMCNANPSLRTQPVAIPGGGRGGPPTIADFDGDGRPELATAGGLSYTVYDLYRAGEEVVSTGAPQPGDVYARWSQTTQDQSSNTTGSSVFDFQGDGAAEVVYADECFMRVYDGASGEVLLETPSSSATIHEYPLVVDVDDDGNSEIIVVANDSAVANCESLPGYEHRRGVYVYGDTFDRWVGTRRVWTSHAYHVTNATSAGNAPVNEVDNWTQPRLNNYRQNVQGEGVFNAPDLTVDLVADLGMCIDGLLEIVATIRNQGALGVPAGVEVSLYEGVDATGPLVGTQTTQVALLPGGQAQMRWEVPFTVTDTAKDFFVAVDGLSADEGVVEECLEDNNQASALEVRCVFPG